MIEINLLPEELRNRVIKPVKQASGTDLTKSGPQLLILIVPLAFILLASAHIYFAFLVMSRSVRLNSLKARWEKSLPERKALEEFNAEHSLISGDAREIQRLLLQRMNWSEKVRKLSVFLPDGVWLEFVSGSGKEFYLKGKAVSLDRAEVSLIRNYIEDVKSDKSFMKNFTSLDLTSIQKNTVGSYEVADFSLTGSLKQQ
ncbi:MAG: hypothetical protein BWY16_00026 [Candidatus Omnitrophica bacterium ADurb.Bin205]|nr:MAG: hypothetical protein BWY16_00026 [Candidatus Omnitrophica bacterium ADurb.Bin205]